MKLDFTNGINNTMSSTQYYVWKTVKDEKGITFVKQTLDVFFLYWTSFFKNQY